MKSEPQSSLFQNTSQHLTHISTLTSEHQINRTKLWEEALQNLYCSKHHQAIMLCCSQGCNQEAPLCGKRKCQCKQQHQNCHNYLQFSNLIKLLLRKTNQKDELIQSIDKIFDQLIDELSAVREKAIEAANNVFFSSQVQKFMEKLTNSSLQQITGQNLYNCSFSIDHQKLIEKDHLKFNDLKTILQIFVQKIRRDWIIFQKNLQIEGLLIKNSQTFKTYVPQVCSIDSEIVTSEQLPALRKFFPQKPFKDANLLYRASQNDFQTAKFWQSCSNIPNTLVVILTQKHKVIGGYTSEPWMKYNRVHQTSDPTLQSFIFSLTEQEKFTLKNPQNATYYINSSWGPQFGIENKGDLSISDKCNLEERSFCFCGNEYANEKNQEQKVDLERFVGQNSQYFKIVDWEVFQLIF